MKNVVPLKIQHVIIKAQIIQQQQKREKNQTYIPMTSFFKMVGIKIYFFSPYEQVV